MFVQQLYTNCLSQAAYYIESDGEAALIDPIRDYEGYIQLAESRGAKIKWIFETHFHADFVSGHLDLAKATGATIVYSKVAQTGFDCHLAEDRERIRIGKLEVEVLLTPGHTPESACYLLKDEQGKDYCVFTGDTLFVGDVGRPDLLDGVMTKEQLAKMMYFSLNKQLKPLADDVILYPGHGPGSACGKNLGPETFSTMGVQKQTNYALQPMSEDEFVKAITEGLTPAPAYFFKDAGLNKNGYPSLETVTDKGLTPLSVEEVDQFRLSEEGIILDTRKPDDFEKGFIESAWNIGLNGQFAIWAANLIDLNTPLVLVTDEGKEAESLTRLARVGFDNIKGYLRGGFEMWAKADKPVDMVISIEPEEFLLDFQHSNIDVVDVRNDNEYEENHIEGALHMGLKKLPNELEFLDEDRDYYIHCAGGYRSMIAASIIKSAGIHRVKNVYGGFSKMKNLEGIPLEAGVKQA